MILLAAATDSPQEASLRFFLPVAAAYVAACTGWLLLQKHRMTAPVCADLRPAGRPWTDLGLALLAAIGILALGQVYRNGWLFPAGSGWMGIIGWQLNNVIIFSPIAAVLLFRRQSLATIYLDPHGLVRKITVGLGLSVVATFVYLALRKELADLPGVWKGVLVPKNLANLPPVMLEGIALAFLFERLRWCVRLVPALLIPSLLFATAHIPSQMESGLGASGIAAFMFLNTLLPMFILYVVSVSRDVIWIAIVHFIMDIAIGAFE